MAVACEALGVAPHVLRYWESRFPLISPARSPGGTRSYSISDMRALAALKRSLSKGLTLDRAIDEVVRTAELRGQGAFAEAEHARMELFEALARCRALNARLQKALKASRTAFTIGRNPA
jgi:DNA-binding transcriptional MerR regulator